MNDVQKSVVKRHLAIRFPSLASLSTEHTTLLKRHREIGNAPELLDDIADFIREGRETGALLYEYKERHDAQSLLDYWVTVLYRANRDPPDGILAEFDEELAPTLEEAQCPYLGLEPFREDDHGLFFGRQRLVAGMVDRLAESRFLAAVGPSGSGKSSAVCAGLLPALKSGAVEGSQEWHYYRPMVPGSNPLASLAALLCPPNVDQTEWVSRQVAHLEQDANHLATLIDELDLRPAVLVIDQFEEIFTLCEDENMRQVFTDNLLGLLQAPEGGHIVILTMRVDFESLVARLPTFLPYFEQARVRVAHLDAKELREAIEKPAEAVGLVFDRDVVDNLLQDILGDPAALPLLQFALLKLWNARTRNRVTWRAYLDLGGGQPGGGRLALAFSADEFYQNTLSVENQETAKRIILRMVRPGEGLEVTSSRIRRESLYQSGEDRSRIDRVLTELVKAHLVRLTGGHTADAQVEIAHEALVRNWPTLLGWLEEERAAMVTRRRLEDKAAEWVRLGRGEGGLLDRVELADAERWIESAAAIRLGYNAMLVDLIEASRRAIEKAEREEEKARQRELERAKALAEEQARSARRLSQLVEQKTQSAKLSDQLAEHQAESIRRLGWLAIALAVVFLLAVTTALYGWRQEREAVGQAKTAEDARQTATVLVVTKSAAEQEAKDQKVIAEARQAEAEAEAAAKAAEVIVRQIAEAEARDARATAEYNMTNYQSLNSILAAEAALRDNRPDLALALVMQADTIVSDTIGLQPLARQALIQAVYRSEKRQRFVYTHPVRSAAISADTLLSGLSDGSLILSDIESGQEIHRFDEAHTGPVWSVAFGPDGRTALSGAQDGTLIWWDLERGKAIRRFEKHTAAVYSVAIGPDGRTALSGSRDGSIRLWDLEGGQEVDSARADWVWCVAFGPDGNSMLSGSESGALILWEIEDGEIVRPRRLKGHSEGVRSVAFGPDGRTALSGSYDDRLILWDLETRSQIAAMEGGGGAVYGVAIGADARTALSGGEDGSVSLWDLEHWKRIHRFRGHADWVRAVAFGPDGRSALSASEDKTSILWDLESVEEIHHLEEKGGHTDAVFGVDIGPDGRTALSGSWDGSLILWDIERGEILRRTEGCAGSVWRVAFSPDGGTALWGCEDGSLVLWDVKTGQEVSRFEGHADTAFGVAFGLDGRTALSSSWDGSLILWNLASGMLVRRFEAHAGQAFGVAFDPEGSAALSGYEDGSLILWDLESGQEVGRFEGDAGPVFDVAFSPDGRTALAGCAEGLILWDVAGGQEIRRFEGGAGMAFDVAFSPDGRTALSGNEDGSVMLWDVARGTLVRRFEGHTGEVYGVTFSADGRIALSGSDDKTMALWDVETGERIRGFGERPYTVSSMAFSSDGGAALSGTSDGRLMLWDVESGREIRARQAHTDTVHSLAFSSHDDTALSGSADGSLIFWDLETGQAIHRLQGHTGAVSTVAFGPRGATALSGSWEGRLILWDLDDGIVLRRFEGHTDRIWSAAFSPDGTTIASSGCGERDRGGNCTLGEIRLWQIEVDKESRRLEEHTDAVMVVTFGPHGEKILSGSQDGTLILWDIAEGVQIHQFEGHSGPVYSAAFSSDGRFALSGSADNSLILWDLETGEQIHRFTGHSDTVYSVTFDLDGRTALSGGGDNSIRRWRIYSPDEIVEWARANRYYQYRPTCAEKERYRLIPLCTPTPALTPSPTVQPTATATPIAARRAVLGDNRGEVPVGGSRVWSYRGQAEQMLTIQVVADRPANGAPEREQLERELLDPVWALYDANGTLVRQASDMAEPRTDARVNILTLPEEGVYQIEVRGRAKLTGGAFTLALAVPTNEIAFGQTVTGTVQTGEHDLWPFVGDLGQIITINLEQDESNLDAYLELIGPDGATLVQDDDGGDGYNSRIERFVLPETGLYVIVARGYSSSSGAYRLTLIKEDEAD